MLSPYSTHLVLSLNLRSSLLTATAISVLKWISLWAIIECKRQNVGGTADQKLPFVYENLQAFERGLVVLDGNHFHKREGIHGYLNSKISDTFDWCFFEELPAWLEENI